MCNFNALKKVDLRILTYNNIRIKKNMKKTEKIMNYFFDLNTLSDLEANILTLFFVDRVIF